MFYIGFLFGSAFSLESSLWSCGENLVLHHGAYLIDLCRPVSEAQGSRSLPSAEKGVLVFARAASMQNRAFSVASPRLWNEIFYCACSQDCIPIHFQVI